MKSTWFKDKRQYELAKLVHSASSRYRNLYDCFSGFLDACSASLSQACYIYSEKEISQKIENHYAEAIERFDNPKAFADAFAVLVSALEEKPQDFLGDVFQALGLNDSSFRGQVFTPFALSQLTAQQTLMGLDPSNWHPWKRLIILEPACGGGSMIIAAYNVLREQGFTPDKYFIVAGDVDHRCVKMSYIQATLLGIPAIIEQRNALSRERWKTYPTLLAVMHPLFYSQNPDYCSIC